MTNEDRIDRAIVAGMNPSGQTVSAIAFARGLIAVRPQRFRLMLARNDGSWRYNSGWRSKSRRSEH
jgi:hypothetical protein